MLLTNTSRIEEMIVLSLAETPNQTAKDVHQSVNRRFGEVSIQAIYQELKKLEKAAVLLRYQRRYSIALHWVLELSSFSDRLYDRYTEPDVVGPLPEPGQAANWQFHSIATLVPVWTHLVVAMAQNSKERVCYEFMDHIWFHLCNSTVEEKFLKAMRVLGVKHYIAVGGDTFLDRQYSNEVTTDSLVLRFGSRVFRSSAERYLSCIGPYVLRIKPKKNLVPEIEEFFGSIVNTSKFHPGAVAEFISRRSSLTLTISHDESEADKVRRAFRQYFVD